MLSTAATSPFLVVPGWGGSEQDHWQSVWESDLAATRVEISDWFHPRRELWVEALDAAIEQLARIDAPPPVLVAHSLGCIVVAHWARTARRPIRAALLVAPADVDRAPCFPTLCSFGPVPGRPLPFRSLVVTSDNDSFVSVERAAEMAQSWGSDLHVIPSGGHLNRKSGLGHWPIGRQLLARLLSTGDGAHLS